MKKEIYEWIVAISVALVLFFIVHTFLFVSYSVKGDSMYPTLKDGEKVIVSKISYTVGDIHRGDVVVFHADEKTDYVKRVIGIAGDTVEYKDDQLLVNGKPVAEPYLDENKLAKTNDLLTENFELSELPNSQGTKVAKDQIFVLGDNREVSMDGRYFGPIDNSKVVGKVTLRYWPFDQFHYNFEPTTK